MQCQVVRSRKQSTLETKFLAFAVFSEEVKIVVVQVSFKIFSVMVFMHYLLNWIVSEKRQELKGIMYCKVLGDK